jgi:hypothetical protein
MLESAWLRVVILDSSKLATETTSSKPFAKLSNNLIDLVVIDDGKTTRQAENLEKFKEVAKGEGVSLAIMQSDRESQ